MRNGIEFVSDNQTVLIQLCWKHPSPFSNMHFRITTNVAAQVLALNFLLPLLLSLSLKL